VVISECAAAEMKVGSPGNDNVWRRRHFRRGDVRWRIVEAIDPSCSVAGEGAGGRHPTGERLQAVVEVEIEASPRGDSACETPPGRPSKLEPGYAGCLGLLNGEGSVLEVVRNLIWPQHPTTIAIAAHFRQPA